MWKKRKMQKWKEEGGREESRKTGKELRRTE
jgi:hypothetical protein